MRVLPLFDSEAELDSDAESDSDAEVVTEGAAELEPVADTESVAPIEPRTSLMAALSDAVGCAVAAALFDMSSKCCYPWYQVRLREQ